MAVLKVLVLKRGIDLSSGLVNQVVVLDIPLQIHIIIQASMALVEPFPVGLVLGVVDLFGVGTCYLVC